LWAWLFNSIWKWMQKPFTPSFHNFLYNLELWTCIKRSIKCW